MSISNVGPITNTVQDTTSLTAGFEPANGKHLNAANIEKFQNIDPPRAKAKENLHVFRMRQATLEPKLEKIWPNQNKFEPKIIGSGSIEARKARAAGEVTQSDDHEEDMSTVENDHPTTIADDFRVEAISKITRDV